MVADCEVFEKLDFPGAMNINDGNKLIVENAGDCCDHCKRTEGQDSPLAYGLNCWDLSGLEDHLVFLFIFDLIRALAMFLL